MPGSVRRPSSPRSRSVLPLVVALLVGPIAIASFVAAPAAAQTAHSTSPADPDEARWSPPGDWAPTERPELTVSRASGTIEVDGVLDDAGWQEAAVAEHFSEAFPEERGRPDVRTRVRIAYDDEKLYLGFHAYDDPTTLRTTFRDRDNIWSDDFVGIMLDTYGDQTWAYEIFANPLGIQGDLRLTDGQGEDSSFDLVYESAGRVVEDGYVVEMAIPFESLRFPSAAEQAWRADLIRIRPRGSRFQYAWAARDRGESCFMCPWGTLRGITGVEPGGALELLPGLVANQTGELRDGDDPSSGFTNDGLEAELSLDFRYAFANGITAEATLNPDFSQVESDVAQIDANTTFALFFPEKRPFFQEGGDLFSSFVDAVYTRSINDPQGAVKGTARIGETSVAYIAARDETTPLLLPFEERSFVGTAGESWSNVLRARQALGESSYLGALVTDRRYGDAGGSGTTFGADGTLRFLEDYRLEFQLLGSRTVEPDAPELTGDVSDLTFDRGAHTAAFDGESYSGYAQYTSFERSARTWGFDVDYWAYSPTFRADNGFVTRNDSHRVAVRNWLGFFPNTSLVDRIEPFLGVERVWNFDGTVKESNLIFNVNGNFAGQTFAAVEYWRDPERFRGIDFDDGWGWNVYTETAFTDVVRFGVEVGGGADIARNLDTPILADQMRFYAWMNIKPLSRLVIEPQVRFQQLTDPTDGSTVFSGYIWRQRTSFQFSRELFLRLVTEYDEFDHRLSVEPLLTYEINPFTMFFVGASDRHRAFDWQGEPDGGFTRTSRQFFAKFQYLLRF